MTIELAVLALMSLVLSVGVAGLQIMLRAAREREHELEIRVQKLERNYDLLETLVIHREQRLEASVRRDFESLLSRRLERTAPLQAAPLPVHCESSERTDGSVRCPFCHGALGANDIVSCVRCEAKHHSECYADHGGCAVFGCGGREIVQGDSLARDFRELDFLTTPALRTRQSPEENAP